MTKVTQNATAPKVRRQAKPEPKPRTVGDLADSMRDSLLMVTRAIAGYHAMSASLNTAMNNLAPGERPRGLPVMTFKATVNGHDTIDVAADLKHVDPAHLTYVLGPLIHAQGRQAQSSLGVLIRDATEMLNLIDKAMSNNVELEVGGEPVVDGDEDEDEEQLDE